MPIYASPEYRPWIRRMGRHAETLYPYLLRRVDGVRYDREHIELPDGDFVDLDWSVQQSSRVLILCHGLEGSSGSQYMLGMSRAALDAGWDVAALNFRSCSGPMNRNFRLYHHGETSDLSFVIDRVEARASYRQIGLCGFSLGGNVVLKYLGHGGDQLPCEVVGGVAVSVPLDLVSSSEALDLPMNAMYTRRFMRSLRHKFDDLDRRFPGRLDMDRFDKVKSWFEFDDTFTSVITGLSGAEEYYQQGSARYFLEGIRRPSLVINAANDPFLKAPSYPSDLCNSLDCVFLSVPNFGGHVGFWHHGTRQSYSEQLALRFLEDVS